MSTEAGTAVAVAGAAFIGYAWYRSRQPAAGPILACPAGQRLSPDGASCITADTVWTPPPAPQPLPGPTPITPSPAHAPGTIWLREDPAWAGGQGEWYYVTLAGQYLNEVADRFGIARSSLGRIWDQIGQSHFPNAGDSVYVADKVHGAPPLIPAGVISLTPGGGGAGTCDPGMRYNGHLCVHDCPPGQRWDAGAVACAPDCGGGLRWNGHACVTACAPGDVRRLDGQVECPVGYCFDHAEAAPAWDFRPQQNGGGVTYCHCAPGSC